MTYIDNFLVLDNPSGAISATGLTSNWLDLGAIGSTSFVEDMGTGENLFGQFTVVTGFAGVGTVDFQIVLQPVTTLAGMTSTVTFTNSTDVVNWTAHGLPTGTPVTFTNSGGGLPTGITSGQTYFVINTGVANTFQVAATLADAFAATPVPVLFTSDGTGTHTAVVTPQVLAASGPIPVEMLTAGSTVRLRLNPLPTVGAGSVALRAYRYLFGKWVEGTQSAQAAAVTTGTVRVEIVKDTGQPINYPSGWTVT